MRRPFSQARSATSPDALLPSLIAAGDWSALGALFQAHGGAVRRFIRNCGVATSDIDDLVQQTFLDVPHASRVFDSRYSCRRWLRGIAAIVVARHRRSKWRQAARQAAFAQDPALHPSAYDAFIELESRQAARRALGALARLPSKKRAVFEMMILDDVSGEDAARALGVSVATVWTRMHYARRDLRRLLEGRHLQQKDSRRVRESSPPTMEAVR